MSSELQLAATGLIWPRLYLAILTVACTMLEKGTFFDPAITEKKNVAPVSPLRRGLANFGRSSRGRLGPKRESTDQAPQAHDSPGTGTTADPHEKGKLTVSWLTHLYAEKRYSPTTSCVVNNGLNP